jgi:hypothetical protein
MAIGKLFTIESRNLATVKEICSLLSRRKFSLKKYDGLITEQRPVKEHPNTGRLTNMDQPETVQ